MLPWVVGVQKKGCAVLNRFSRVRLFGTLWTVACPATLSMGFSRQEYWSGLSFPSPGDLPNPGIELHWQVGSLPLGLPGKPQRKATSLKSSTAVHSCLLCKMEELQVQPRGHPYPPCWAHPWLSWPHSQDQPRAHPDQQAPLNKQTISTLRVSPLPSLMESGAPQALGSHGPISGVSTPSRKTASQKLGPLSPVLIRYRLFLLCLKKYFWFLLWLLF